jgi:hypothetical protein
VLSLGEAVAIHGTHSQHAIAVDEIGTDSDSNSSALSVTGCFFRVSRAMRR